MATEELKEEKVMVDKSKLDNILSRINELELQNAGGGTNELKRPDFHTARVRMIKGKAVVNYSKTWTEREDNGDEILKLEVETEDGKKHTVDYLKFMRESEIEEVKILKQNVNNKIRNDGFVEVTDVQGYRTVGLGSKIRAEVVEPITESEVEFKDGRTLLINNLAFNS